MKFIFPLILMFSLLACGTSPDQISAQQEEEPPVDPPVEPKMLCVADACGTFTDLGLHIPDAENLHFTPEGRLFISGSTDIWEITKDGESYQASGVAEVCNFTGMAQIGDVLYANCLATPSQLYAGIIGETVALASIYTYTGVNGANGMAVDAAGNIYTVDGPTSGTAKISKLTLNANNPLQVDSEEVWLGTGLQFPNGLAQRNGVLYVINSSLDGGDFGAQSGAVYEVPIKADGSAGELEKITDWVGGILDDLSFVDDNRVLVGDFSTGRAGLIHLDGTVEQSTNGTNITAATHVVVGQPPLFDELDIIITDKGALGDSTEGAGNKVWRLSPNE